jgi:hypothetical protein
MSFVVARQGEWLEAIERRISSTTSVLGAMKGIKMSGLKHVILKTLHKLRIDELNISKGFRRLLIWNMALGEWLILLFLFISLFFPRNGDHSFSVLGSLTNQCSIYNTNFRTCHHICSLFDHFPQQRRRCGSRYGPSVHLIITVRSDG